MTETVENVPADRAERNQESASREGFHANRSLQETLPTINGRSSRHVANKIDVIDKIIGGEQDVWPTVTWLEG